MCRGSPVALNHEALNIGVDDPFFPLPFKGDWSLSQLHFLFIAVNRDILEGAPSD